MSKMASHWPFGHMSPKLWAQERPGVKREKVGNRPLPNLRIESARCSWKDLDEGYNFGLDLVAIRFRSREL